MKHKGPITLRHLLAPRQWPLWLGIGVLRLLILLPFRTQVALGKQVGRLFYRFAPDRVAIARQNIDHCFPDLATAERQQLLQQHFEALGISVFETALTWWGRESQLHPLLGKLSGLEHLQAAQQRGQGVILLCAHFTDLEISAKLLLLHTRFAVVYRQLNNPVLEFLTAQGRGHHSDEAIPKDNIKRMVKLLREGKTIWFAADQSYRRKHSQLIPFFGQPAPTATVISSLAKAGKAEVLPFNVARVGNSYELEILPPLDDFPSGDAVADTTRYNQLIEEQVRRVPEQYLWTHRRFKGAPDFKYQRR